MGKVKDLTGQRFGRLVVIKRIYTDCKKHGVIWECRCDCKNIISTRSSSLLTGNTSSCGCLRIENLNKALSKHNLCGSSTYNSWQSMLRRCLTHSNPGYKYYGGRGIKVCKRWQGDDGFKNFLEDMGERPKGLEIDRKNNNLHYSCGKCEECIENDWKFNCRWGTRLQQVRNRRCSSIVTYNNKTQHIEDWALELNISPFILYRRIFLDKWDVEKAFITPPLKAKDEIIKIEGVERKFSEWLKVFGVYKKLVYSRLRMGWSVEEALMKSARNYGK